MELIVSAVMSDLLNRALSMAIERYRRSKAEETEHKLRRLHRVLLRIDAMVEEAEGRHITNQAMLRQLQLLRHGMYQGHHLLDTVKYRYSGDDDASGDDLPAALPRFSSARRLLSRPFSFSSDTCSAAVPVPVPVTALGAESWKQLEKTLDDLETLVGDMAEFTLFLKGYTPRISRQPYSAHLVVGSVMFGRQAEMEAVIDFLLRPEPEAPAGNGNPGVLPIVGAARMGKSTLVEHVCLDERVRRHFSSIVVFTIEDLGAAGDLAAFRGNAVVKHQEDATAAASHGHGKSLAVIELAGGDVDDETWRRLYSSAASSMGTGSKIVITSRSEKIAALGTTGNRALRLEALSREAYWYVFKSLVFGGADPGDQPELASLGMRIAELLDGSFLAGNVMASLMRANMNARFWRRVLHCVRDYTRRHVLQFGERPNHLLQKGKSVCLWRVARAHEAVTICSVYRLPSTQDHVPDVTLQDLLSGRVTREGDFSALAWRSTIPPYYTYLVGASQTARCSTVNKKRPRYARE